MRRDDARARAELLTVLALLHLEHGQSRRGLTYALLAHCLAPAAPLARRLLAYALLRNGAPEEALTTLGPRDPDAPADAALERLRAECLAAAGKPAAARDALLDALLPAAKAAA